MGAGKSTVGKALARQLGWEFVDTDHVIEQATGVSIPTIFEIEGEEGFRKRETQTLATLLEKPQCVLATGGGIVINPQNRAMLKALGDVVYLKASTQDLMERTKLDKNRPLLQHPDPESKIEELLKVRRPMYQECADLVIETGRQPVNQIVHKICKALKPAPREEQAQILTPQQSQNASQA